MTPIDGPGSSGAEHADRSTTSGSAGAPGVRSVAEEAALLVDLLSQRGWSGSSGMPPGRARSNGDAPRDGADEPAGRGGQEERRGHGDHGAHGSGRECTCGGTTPAACRVCPLCQLIAFVQQVNPDTIEKVADVVGFAATALRDLATAQRERHAGAADAPPTPPPPTATPPPATANDDPERTRPGDRA
ncbi:hypothetical protein [Terrabacter sp. MAHUQ-38]|uniref:hypothetical protein n=1 Tax=unclassified Terrabacter TaxID=2630222 RepID=UPI00165D7075|nr:hypothetical protein [Terrabacter sp. MAHUQ-38]MBC9823641.1 hypothetical protein [Terrabacter sp. MAHUQ-38]